MFCRPAKVVPPSTRLPEVFKSPGFVSSIEIRPLSRLMVLPVRLAVVSSAVALLESRVMLVPLICTPAITFNCGTRELVTPVRDVWAADTPLTRTKEPLPFTTNASAAVCVPVCEITAPVPRVTF